jgi:hypothetical protein
MDCCADAGTALPAAAAVAVPGFCERNDESATRSWSAGRAMTNTSAKIKTALRNDRKCAEKKLCNQCLLDRPSPHTCEAAGVAAAAGLFVAEAGGGLLVPLLLFCGLIGS